MTASDHKLAAELAHGAGQLLLAFRDEIGVGDPTLKDEGDRRSNQHLLAGLAAARPDDAILSEESPDDDVRLTAPRVWIIDPLDGTHEYSEGRADWAVHVALWEGTRPLICSRLDALSGRPIAFGPGRPLHSPNWRAADALPRQLAHAGRDQKLRTPARPSHRWPRSSATTRSRILPRVQEGIRCSASHVATFEQLGQVEAESVSCGRNELSGVRSITSGACVIRPRQTADYIHPPAIPQMLGLATRAQRIVRE